MLKTLMVVVVAVIIVALGVVVFSGGNYESFVSTDEASNSDSATTLYIGSPEAPVTMIEYLDFKCPQCNQYHQTVAKKIQAEYIDTNKINVVVRAYPFLGPDSGRALRGAYCANEQGVFEDYHNVVLEFMWDEYYKEGEYQYEIEDVLTVERLTAIFEQLNNSGSDIFKECIESNRLNPLIDRDLDKAGDDGVMGTPSFIVGKQKVVGPQPFENFKTLLDIQLNS